MATSRGVVQAASQRGGRRPLPRTNPSAPVLTPASLIGLIIAAADLSVLPSRTWALQVALAALETATAKAGTAAAGVLRAWPRRVGGAGREFVGVDQIVRQLVKLGHLSPEGYGWRAGYRVGDAWRRQSDELI